MAVAEMSVMTLVGLSAEKNNVLDGLQKCGAAQIRCIKEREELTPAEIGGAEDYSVGIERAERAVSVVSAAVMELDKKERPEIEADGFGVTKEEFFATETRREEIEKVISEIEDMAALRSAKKAEAAKIAAEIKAFSPYCSVEEPFDFYKDTSKAAVYLGTAIKDRAAKLIDGAREKGAIAEIISEGSECVVAIIAHKGDKELIDALLSQSAFKRCPYSGDTTAKKEVEKLQTKLDELWVEDEEILTKIVSFAPSVKDLKLYSDYLSFLKEKALSDSMMGETQSAFLLEAYVPTEAVERVKEAVKSVTEAVFLEFEPVPRNETAPILNKNGKIASNFEVVTNMYSSPAYGALDPNAVMAFFFSLFMGVIMADVGYGVLMIIGGFVLAARSRKGTSIARMAKVFAYGGIFAIIFGAVLDSFMGFQLFHRIFGEEYAAFYAAHINPVDAKASLAGIDVHSSLLWCLGLGTAHMAVGLVLKAVQCFTRKQYLEGIFGGVTWAVALFALIAWIYCLVTETEPAATYSMYVTAGAVAIGILTAGVGQKGADIVIKPFTATYGLINYVSDILSYARLYGLMLAGSQIASIFTNTLALDMLMVESNGFIGIIAGVLIIIVGNVFNLAISLPGAYIHDARLQYVEFYGKFYEGEGELFKPFGNSLNHGYFEN
ncbi:MAG: hypothetical protein J6Y44_02330 [Clostridia bacterium]|nr:hypothetical protein [Clostridia bacterium]